MKTFFTDSQWKEIKAALHYICINGAIFIAMLIPVVQEHIDPKWLPILAIVLNFITYKTQLVVEKGNVTFFNKK